MLPPTGRTFFLGHEQSAAIDKVSHDLRKVAAFLQSLDHFCSYVYFHDWWEHDGLHFEKVRDTSHKLFQMVGTSRELLQATPDDEDVYVGVSPESDRWYLRFRAEWDEQGEHLQGRFSVTLNELDAALFETHVMPHLECVLDSQAAKDYFQDRIV